MRIGTHQINLPHPSRVEGLKRATMELKEWSAKQPAEVQEIVEFSQDLVENRNFDMTHEQILLNTRAIAEKSTMSGLSGLASAALEFVGLGWNHNDQQELKTKSISLLADSEAVKENFAAEAVFELGSEKEIDRLLKDLKDGKSDTEIGESQLRARYEGRGRPEKPSPVKVKIAEQFLADKEFEGERDILGLLAPNFPKSMFSPTTSLIDFMALMGPPAAAPEALKEKALKATESQLDVRYHVLKNLSSPNSVDKKALDFVEKFQGGLFSNHGSTTERTLKLVGIEQLGRFDTFGDPEKLTVVKDIINQVAQDLNQYEIDLKDICKTTCKQLKDPILRNAVDDYYSGRSKRTRRRRRDIRFRDAVFFDTLSRWNGSKDMLVEKTRGHYPDLVELVESGSKEPVTIDSGVRDSLTTLATDARDKDVREAAKQIYQNAQWRDYGVGSCHSGYPYYDEPQV